MSRSALVELPPASSGPGQDPDKRSQILDGARQVFLARGFAAASMGEIARAAQVSKGTLYVYFENKERLFAGLVEQQCRQFGETMPALDPEEQDVRGALVGTGRRYLENLVLPDQNAWLRTVVGAVEQFPELGQVFLDSGPRRGVKRLAEWFRSKIARRELAIDDVELAAWQFLMLCQGPVSMPMLLGGETRPNSARIQQVVERAVEVFLSAYSPRA